MSDYKKRIIHHRKSDSCGNPPLGTEPTNTPRRRPQSKHSSPTIVSRKNSNCSDDKLTSKNILSKYFQACVKRETALSHARRTKKPPVNPSLGKPSHKRAMSGDSNIDNIFSISKRLDPKHSRALSIKNIKENESSLETTARDKTAPESTREKIIASITTYFHKTGLPPPTSLAFYKFGKPLGKGAFGKVFLGIHQLTGLKVAIKRIEKSVIRDERTRNKVFQEVFIMKRVCHPNVIRLLEVFESSKHLLIVLEYAGGGDLLQLIKAKGRITEAEAKLIFRQIIEGVSACHAVNVIHRDIKLDNILVNTAFNCVKLCDFGVSRVACPGQRVSEQCGTPAYLAPEIILNKGYDPLYVDTWSMGVLLYAMLCGTVPFKANTLPELHKLILQCKYRFPGYLSGEVREFITRMLNPIPQQRISLEEMVRHEWFETQDQDSSFEDSAAPCFVGVDLPTGKRVNQQEILGDLRELGFPEDYVVQSLKLKDINHATATFQLFELRN